MLVAENITLEIIDDHHAEALHALVDENRTYLKTWLPWVDHMKTVDNFRRFIKESRKRYADRNEIAYVIIYNKILIGRIGLYHLDHQNKIASIGYWIDKESQGYGIITRCCNSIINYAFSSLDFNRIEIKCGTENIKSSSIAERLNFKKEGILRQAEMHQDRFIDLYLYSMLKNDWNARM
jgi:ribosomal-protein-serine acetyltransferase